MSTLACISITPISTLIRCFCFVYAVIGVDAERVVAQMGVLVGVTCQVSIIRDWTELRILPEKRVYQKGQTNVFLPRFATCWHHETYSPSTILIVV
jgi:metal-sulfur cluster biosynthetic enzyme